MNPRINSITVVGIDVGGYSKGFHAVALTGGVYREHKSFKDIAELVCWSVHERGAQMIAVDAPCGWSTDGRARPAERELMQKKIWCFATPSEKAAKERKERAARGETTNHFGWMLRGAELYRALKSTHPVLGQRPRRGDFCTFETFPHAITWHLLCGHADAKRKRSQRSHLLREAGIAFDAKVGIDFIDAALCALTAHKASSGEPLEDYGESETGLIIVPAQQ
ncbi:MAG: hypothetical protein RL015_1351 [Verrucomicrobiota bacterium]|jgi:predicted nuclease with RNAse H fold